MRVPAVLLTFLVLLGILAACRTPVLLPIPNREATSSTRLWQDRAIFEAVTAELTGASSRVLVEMYEFGRPDLEAALLSAQKRGVEVRLIVDPTVTQSVGTARRLTAAGLPVRLYPVDDRVGQIDHVKLLIADVRALVGGMNWGAHSDRNHDYALELADGASLTRLSAIFEQDWALAGGDPRPLPTASGSIAQTAPGAEIRAGLERWLRNASESIRAEIFALTDGEVIRLLVAAHRRGVGVRVLLDPSESVNRPAYSRLLSAGVPVRWFRPEAGGKLHAKALGTDAQLLLGSANWSRHGLDVNHELDVTTADQTAVAAYRAKFEIDWEGAALPTGGIVTRPDGAAIGSSSASSCACACASSCAAS